MQGGTGRAVVNPGTPHERMLAPLSDGTVLRRGDILRWRPAAAAATATRSTARRNRCCRMFATASFRSEAARRDYGVAIVGDAVDEAATRRCAGQRGRSAKAFHRKGYVDAIG